MAVGDEVMLTSGIYGVIRALEDDVIRIEVAESVVLKVVRGAVGSVVPVPDPTLPPSSTEEH